MQYKLRLQNQCNIYKWVFLYKNPGSSAFLSFTAPAYDYIEAMDMFKAACGWNASIVSVNKVRRD